MKPTRLVAQIEKMEEKLNAFKTFSEEKLNLFEKALPEIKKVLTSYSVKIIDANNTFIDESPIEDGKLFLRIYLKVENVPDSDVKKKNMEKKLREFAPMPICPIGWNSISFYYHN